MSIDAPDERTVDIDPFVQFSRWYAEAVRATGDRAAAMTVATVGNDGHPSARVVLLRGHDARGFVFYTNYESRKGHEIASNEAVAAVVYWSELDAQVRIEGIATRVTRAESAAYFAGRPRGHQIGAWASQQSTPVADRATLEAQVRDAELRYPGDVPLPSYWGGYRIEPTSIEFWKSGADRVHDRVVYTRSGDTWVIQRLSP